MGQPLDGNSDHSLTDVVAGRDTLDSTSVDDPYTSFELPDDISLSGVHVGIPKVGGAEVQHPSFTMQTCAPSVFFRI